MKKEFEKLKNDLETLIEELEEENFFFENQRLIIGCSTSEVIGEHIGKNSSLEVAEVIFNGFRTVREKYDIHLMFQGCEHINRAVTMDRRTSVQFGFDEVSVVPHRSAGGSLSEYAYQKMADPVVAEFVTADSGIDIGQTMIGMHLKHVAVPLRTNTRLIGEAVVTIAKTRPKLIGGPRAKYNN